MPQSDIAHLLIGLRAQLSGQSDADITTLRLNSYSGSQYFAPGYVNQFKNVLLPALVVIVITYYSMTKDSSLRHD